ncbi:MAG: hypothetical protein GXX94_00685 [Chloroflexi bacterium]|nr:hypothetical protein [Chloroflexota bacterium]
MAGKYPSERCAICGEPLESPEFASNYPNFVCQACNSRAVNQAGEPPQHDSWGDDGDNPVYVDAHRCWRRYRYGGHIAMRDDDDCPDLFAFYRLHHWG